VTTLVIDASIALKWVVEEDGTPHLLDSRQIEPALRTGYARAKVEAEKIQKFWA
jgi:NTE family protein